MSDVASRSLWQVEAYFTVREILPETSKGADGVHWREISGFGRFRFATLGLTEEYKNKCFACGSPVDWPDEICDSCKKLSELNCS
jgi:hypothetical protein